MRWSSVTNLAAGSLHTSANSAVSAPPSSCFPWWAWPGGAVPGGAASSAAESLQRLLCARTVIKVPEAAVAVQHVHLPARNWAGTQRTPSIQVSEQASDGNGSSCGCKPVTYITSPPSRPRPPEFLISDRFLFISRSLWLLPIDTALLIKSWLLS